MHRKPIPPEHARIIAEAWLMRAVEKENNKCISAGLAREFEKSTIDPEWEGDCRHPDAGCWHVVYAQINSSVADPVYCRKPCMIGSRYCIEHVSEQYERDDD